MVYSIYVATERESNNTPFSPKVSRTRKPHRQKGILPAEKQVIKQNLSSFEVVSDFTWKIKKYQKKLKKRIFFPLFIQTLNVQTSMILNRVRKKIFYRNFFSSPHHRNRTVLMIKFCLKFHFFYLPKTETELIVVTSLAINFGKKKV